MNKDLNYVKLVKETIARVLKQYAQNLYTPDFLLDATPEQLQSMNFTINHQLLLETLLCEIRGTTVQYCCIKKKKKNELLNLALHKLENAENKADSQPDNIKLRQELDSARKEVEEFEKHEAEGAIIRARLKWQLEGEKPSRYFCNLEKYNALQKYIPRLKIKTENKGEHIISDQVNIDKELRNFYSDLYKSQEPKNIGTIENFLGKNGVKKCPKITEKEASQLEGLISIDEATSYIKKCRSDASPGSSGFTGGFFKCFWRDLKKLVVDSFNYAYEAGNLALSQKLGVIILLPKPNKDKLLLSNWRPISLLNQCYKILSGVLAER